MNRRFASGAIGGAVLTALALLAACGGSPDDPGLGGLSPGEAAGLNDAAAMLDANSVALENDATEEPAR